MANWVERIWGWPIHEDRGQARRVLVSKVLKEVEPRAWPRTVMWWKIHSRRSASLWVTGLMALLFVAAMVMVQFANWWVFGLPTSATFRGGSARLTIFVKFMALMLSYGLFTGLLARAVMMWSIRRWTGLSYVDVVRQREACAGCGHSLLGVPEAADGCRVCPECGAAWRFPVQSLVVSA